MLLLTLLRLDRSLIKSKLDYGCVVYSCARLLYLKMLEPIHNHALGLCLGAFRTSPAISLCVEATKPPLALRRKKLSSQYCLKLSAYTNSPAYNAIFNSKFKIPFDSKQIQTRPMGFRVLGFKSNLQPTTLPTTVSSIPPWLLNALLVISVCVAMTTRAKQSEIARPSHANRLLTYIA